MLPMNQKIDCSLLIVSRPSWPAGLERCLETLARTTPHPDNVEIMLKIDHNAADGILQSVQKWQYYLPIKPIVMDGIYRRDGVPNYTNVLAWNSTGKLLWWWSEEVRMLTPNWNEVIKKYSARYNQINIMFEEGRLGFYPCMTRKFYETIGRFTYSLCLDSFCELTVSKVKNTNLVNETGPLFYDQLRNLELMEGIKIKEDKAIHREKEQVSPKVFEIEKYIRTKDLLPIYSIPAENMPITHADLNSQRVKDLFAKAREILFQEHLKGLKK